MALYGTRLANVYTSEDEIAQIYSEEGVVNVLEDLLDDDDYVTALIERATARVNQYLIGIYSPANLANSVWVRERATYIACYFLSARRGNPTLYQYQYEEALSDLQEARDNLISIDLPQSSGVRPLAYNVLHDNRFTVTPVRIIQATSSRMVPGQLASFANPFWWW